MPQRQKRCPNLDCMINSVTVRDDVPSDTTCPGCHSVLVEIEPKLAQRDQY